MTYDEFEDTARELFGLDAAEAADLASSLDAAEMSPEAWDVDDPLFWEIASDAADPYFEAYYEDIEEPYPLDPFFPGDDYLDPGDVWEMTAEAYGDKN